MTTILLALTLAGAYLALAVARVAIATRALDRSGSTRTAVGERPVPTEGSVSVVQAIRSGDPLMPGLLRENLRNHPAAHVVLLVDEDDPAGRRAAQDAADEVGDRDLAGPGRVEVLVTPPLPPGLNPKVFKLAIALPRCGPVVAVLDDDTVLPPGALDRAVARLSDGELVTGVPVYREQGSVWSRLVAAFVNGNSLVTYLPVARRGQPVTINGMFYVTRRADLESLGGFRAIEHLLCDDYEIARLYRASGRTIVQSTVVHGLATTVTGPREYARIMRRWMVFARQVLAADLSPSVLLLVVVPALLPLAALAASVVSGEPVVVAAVLGVLLVKAGATWALRRRVPPAPSGLLGVLLEVVADVVLPLHVLAAAVRPSRVVWRGRDLEAGPGGVVVGATSTPST